MKKEQNSSSLASNMPSTEALQTRIVSLQQQLKQTKVLLNELLSSSCPRKCCPSKHPLRYIHGENLEVENQCCQCGRVCHQVSTIRWSCLRCQYDLCVWCGGWRLKVCPYLHLLTNRKHEEDAWCDVCLKEIVGGCMACECGFCMCKDCEKKGLIKQQE